MPANLENSAVATELEKVSFHSNPKECSNYCTIALISHASKVILSPGAVSLIPSAVPASVSARASWVRLLSFPGSWSLAVTLPVDVNHPESEEVFG